MDQQVVENFAVTVTFQRLIRLSKINVTGQIAKASQTAHPENTFGTFALNEDVPGVMTSRI